MSLQNAEVALLGLLSEGARYPYQIEQEVKQRDLAYWTQLSMSSIYKILRKLESRALVQSHVEVSEENRTRKVYRITDAGRASFAESLASMRPQHKLRSEFLAVMYFADLMEPERLEHLLNDRLEELTGTLSQLAAIQNGWGPDTPAGAKFVAGFGAAVAESAARYIEANQHLLVGDREAANAEQPVVPAVAAGHHS